MVKFEVLGALIPEDGGPSSPICLTIDAENAAEAMRRGEILARQIYEPQRTRRAVDIIRARAVSEEGDAPPWDRVSR